MAVRPKSNPNRSFEVTSHLHEVAMKFSTQRALATLLLAALSIRAQETTTAVVTATTTEAPITSVLSSISSVASSVISSASSRISSAVISAASSIASESAATATQPSPSPSPTSGALPMVKADGVVLGAIAGVMAVLL
ncbi:hypothetical protein AMATHDRAFT_4184 [Amanita thiersii Skay4041]|uniref:Uncharacterized protein n=1 Tax=Amanita thiersii Skay4041 TaxID=703135 RepID=A0A2A9NJC2_9AGAR|nr:hypothetical protein AMATHDRAFT_4184 [Amanita thiersii Skay4041]